MMKNINTYGGLCEEIERVEKALEEIRSRSGYEYLEDDVDFILYLDHLKETKEYNERRYKMMQDFGLYECEKCGSIDLDVESQVNLKAKGYDVAVECNTCGHVKFSKVYKNELKEYLPNLIPPRKGFI